MLKKQECQRAPFPTGFQSRSLFLTFSLGTREHSTNVDRRCFIVPCAVGGLGPQPTGVGPFALRVAHGTASSARSSGRRQGWVLGTGCWVLGAGCWARSLCSLGRRETGLGIKWEGKGAWSPLPERPRGGMADRGFPHGLVTDERSCVSRSEGTCYF